MATKYLYGLLCNDSTGSTGVSGVANRRDAVGRAGRLVPRQSCSFGVRMRTLNAGTPKNREFTGACNCCPHGVLEQLSSVVSSVMTQIVRHTQCSVETLSCTLRIRRIRGLLGGRVFDGQGTKQVGSMGSSGCIGGFCRMSGTFTCQ
jgi:hypothetical protein